MTVVNIDDLRKLAKRRLPRAVFDFIDGGAEDEITLRQNTAAFERITFRPRVLVDARNLDQSVSVLGQRLSTPLILAPTGLCGMAAPRGEIRAARAAARTGALFVLSSMSALVVRDGAPPAHRFRERRRDGGRLARGRLLAGRLRQLAIRAGSHMEGPGMAAVDLAGSAGGQRHHVGRGRPTGGRVNTAALTRPLTPRRTVSCACPPSSTPAWAALRPPLSSPVCP